MAPTPTPLKDRTPGKPENAPRTMRASAAKLAARALSARLSTPNAGALKNTIRQNAAAPTMWAGTRDLHSKPPASNLHQRVVEEGRDDAGPAVSKVPSSSDMFCLLFSITSTRLNQLSSFHGTSGASQSPCFALVQGRGRAGPVPCEGGFARPTRWCSITLRVQ